MVGLLLGTLLPVTKRPVLFSLPTSFILSGTGVIKPAPESELGSSVLSLSGDLAFLLA
jgi:hypothetical protein